LSHEKQLKLDSCTTLYVVALFSKFLIPVQLN
jgi:hypothetical protein